MVAIVLKAQMVVDYNFTNIVIKDEVVVEFNGGYICLYDEEPDEDEFLKYRPY